LKTGRVEPTADAVSHAQDLETEPLGIVDIDCESLLVSDGLHRSVRDDWPVVSSPRELMELCPCRWTNEAGKVLGIDPGKIADSGDPIAG
jgi:hypothetical protein